MNSKLCSLDAFDHLDTVTLTREKCTPAHVSFQSRVLGACLKVWDLSQKHTVLSHSAVLDEAAFNRIRMFPCFSRREHCVLPRLMDMTGKIICSHMIPWEKPQARIPQAFFNSLENHLAFQRDKGLHQEFMVQRILQNDHSRLTDLKTKHQVKQYN